jgi:sporulation protein YlmC with PRC-barrel domain
MKKSYREILHTPIRDRLTRGLLGRVHGSVVNPTNGEVVALYTTRDGKMLIPTSEISRYAAEEIWLESPEALALPGDIIRIAEVIAGRTPILGQKVFTVSRQHLGQVLDYEIETNGWIITKLAVAKRILGIPTEQKLIDTRQVIRITSSEITVQDAAVLAYGKTTKNPLLADLPEGTAGCLDDQC